MTLGWGGGIPCKLSGSSGQSVYLLIIFFLIRNFGCYFTARIFQISKKKKIKIFHFAQSFPKLSGVSVIIYSKYL